ncbi:MAG: acetyl-CoA carboxylase biotin carboxyl carrier protein [Eubacteriales bacterium]|nr:acetyl-CoA carboxylase biotin carboxyl carrier protein [Eubacteriales bacterium]
MELENVLKLITAFSESSLTSFTLDDGNTKLSFAADRNEGETSSNVVTKVVTVNPEVAVENVVQGSAVSDNAHTVNSPLVGVFYSASSPEESPFVSVGDHVKKGQVLGIVEAMKLMNEIESDYEGVVKEILVNNEQMVEYGQPMFVIE